MMAMNKIIPALVAFCVTVSVALAQDWPAQPIHMIIAYGPGGGSDIVGRILAQALEQRLGKPVIVENKPGAGGILGNELVANATPDGYTLGIMTAGQIIAAVRRKDMPYDTHALTPVAQVATASMLMAGAARFRREQPQGPGRSRQSAAGQGHLRQSGLQRHPAFCRRTAQADRGHRHAGACRFAVRPKPSMRCLASMRMC